MLRTRAISKAIVCSADDAQARSLLDQVGGELGGRANDDRVVGADLLRQVPFEVDIDIEFLLEHLDAAVGDLLPNQDFRSIVHRASPSFYCSKAASALVTAAPRLISTPMSASTSSSADRAVTMSNMS